jgi:arginase family enzyme
MSFRCEGVTFLNFDGTYFSQKQLLAFPHEWMDMTDVSHTNLYCQQSSLREIEKRINWRTNKGIVFIGSGNYHYVSYLLLKEMKEPFTLLLFDHHTDMGNEQDSLISCGSWVSYALKDVPFLEKVVMIGSSNLQQGPHLSSKVTIFSNDYHSISPKLLLSNIQTHSVYISIDKDVLCRDDAVTNWDQGTMKLSFLLECLDYILSHKKVVGVDVCGEYPRASVDVFHPICREANRKNEYANKRILETCLQKGTRFTHHPRLA